METIIALLIKYAEGLFKAEDTFFEDLGTFTEFEGEIYRLSKEMSSGFISAVLSEADDLIRKNGKRIGRYIVQRQEDRTLISIVGDVIFKHTLYRSKESGKYRYLLDDLIKLPNRERFTVLAEARLLSEAEAHSYQHAAESLTTNDEAITKTTVMNKIHGIREEMPKETAPAEFDRKAVKYLYIEADEDHIHAQRSNKKGGGMMGKLIYVFEGKESVCEGRTRLINPRYFGGLYPGSKENEKLWDEVEKYINDHYDEEALRRVYIASDGGGWIKAGAERISKSVMVADKFHLMKYINRASNLIPEAADNLKRHFYKYIYRKDLTMVKGLIDLIGEVSEREDITEDIMTYIENSWDGIIKAFHDKHAIGCSAEGHISNVYSDRMSSRPMGWSEEGSDRMCRLRCYVKNYGRGKLIDLVKYKREQKLKETLPATGTDGMEVLAPEKHYDSDQRRARAYIERLQATISDTSIIKKTFAIREQLKLI